jgi:ferric-dicitrate binding protein FerR (iron transport regulator)
MNSRQRRKYEAERHNIGREKKAAQEKRWAELLAGADPENDDERTALARHEAKKRKAQRAAALLLGLAAGFGR